MANPAFTARFQADLVRPGLRLPVTADAALFREAAALGRKVIWLHCYGERFADPSAGRPAASPRMAKGEGPTIPAEGMIPGAPEPLPEMMAYDPALKRLSIGKGFIDNVPKAVWDYEVSGKNVLRQWFSYRKRDRTRPIIGDRRPPSPLDRIQPDHWLDEYTVDLMNLLHVLGSLVALEPRQAEVLERICAGLLITAQALEAAGALASPPTTKGAGKAKAAGRTTCSGAAVAETPPAASRRGFLKALGLGATQAALPGAAEPTASTARMVAPVVVLPASRVAGAEKRLSVAERLALQPGMRLSFRREPDNRYDKRAVLIELVGDGKLPRAIGYVPRHENRTIADLIDAGHEVAGELLPSERFTLHNRVRPGEEPDPEHRLVEEVKRTEDGGRIVKVEAVRPQFRAWIATGQIGEAKPPDPNEVPGEPGWTRIVEAHRATRLSYDAYFTHPIAWTVGMELALARAARLLARLGDVRPPHA